MRVLISDAQEWSGLGAIRSLGRAGHNITSGYPVGIKPPPSVYSKYCNSSVCYPDPWSWQFEFREWLKKELNTKNYDVFLPITEATVVAAASMRELFKKELIILMPSDYNLNYALSKYNSMVIAEEIGIPIPKTVFIKDINELNGWNDYLEGITFPAVIKSDNYISEDGRYNKGTRTIVNNQIEARSKLNEYKNLATSLIIQEYIYGYGLAAFLLRYNGKTLLRFAHKRIHEIPYSGGYSSLRQSIKDDKIMGYAEKLLDSIDYYGLAMVEFRYNKLDKKPYFLEINGRLWGSIALALHSGIDFPLRLLECYTINNIDIKQPSYKEGVLCRNTLQGEIRHLKSVYQAHKLNKEDAPSRLLKTLEFIYLTMNPFVKHDHFWYSDPKPFIKALKYTLSDYFPRVFKVH